MTIMRETVADSQNRVSIRSPQRLLNEILDSISPQDRAL